MLSLYLLKPLCCSNSQIKSNPFILSLSFSLGFPDGSAGKESCNAKDLGSIPELGRSPGERKGYPLQYSDLKNSMDYTVAKSQTRLSNFHIAAFKAVKVLWSFFNIFWKILFLSLSGLGPNNSIKQDHPMITGRPLLQGTSVLLYSVSLGLGFLRLR